MAIKICHLNDDFKLGGITRSLPALLQRLDPQLSHSVHNADPKRRLAPALDADIIVLHFPPAWGHLAWLVSLKLRNPRAKIVMVEHSYTRRFETLHVPNKSRFRLMLRLTYGLVDHVVTVSRAQGDWLREAADLAANKITSINPMTDLASLRRLTPPVRSHGPLRLCGFGRFCAQKGFDTLIEAMRLVPAETVTLRLVGLGEDEAALRARAAGLAHVSIEGPVPGPDGLFGEIDAVAIPSRFEAFGNVGAEARAAARPIIVTDVDGLFGQALPNVPQLRIRPDDELALAAAIVWLASQDLTVLGIAGRAMVADAETSTIAAWNQLFHAMAA